jgi:hypothetical protein
MNGGKGRKANNWTDLVLRMKEEMLRGGLRKTFRNSQWVNEWQMTSNCGNPPNLQSNRILDAWLRNGLIEMVIFLLHLPLSEGSYDHDPTQNLGFH